jgi:molecular chaperone GrpE
MSKKQEDPLQLKLKIAELEEEVQALQEALKETETLEKQIEAQEVTIESLTNTSKRALADLSNFKNRVNEEKKSLINFANSNLIIKLLPILDNFQRALKHDGNIDENWEKGIELIYNQFSKEMTELGVEQFKSLGETLDPEKHEALMQGPGEKDMITEVFEEGYTLKGKVIRHSKVKVGDGSKA